MLNSIALWMYCLMFVDATISTAAIEDEGTQSIQLASETDVSQLDISPILNVSNLSPSLTRAAMLFNSTSANTDYDFVCDGSTYGFNVNVDDCLDALDRFRKGGDRITFAERGSPAAESRNVLPLPWRWMGRKSRYHYYISTAAAANRLILS